MSSRLTVARSALKLAFFASSLTVASLGAQLATADSAPDGKARALGVTVARASGGDLSDRSLRRTFDAESSDLFARHDPGVRRPVAVDILKGYEDGAPLARWTLMPRSAEAANQGVPLPGEQVIAAKPFAFKGGAADRQAALTCLAQAVYYEAGYEPMEGAQAVAQVVLNRVRHPIFPKSICGVVYQGAELKTGCQFSFTCDGSLNRAPAAAAWARAKAVAERALGGYVAKGVGEATHYHTTAVLPWWAPTVTKIAQVGTQIFYRWPGGLGLPSAFIGRYAGGERVGGERSMFATGAPLMSDVPTYVSTKDGRVHVYIAANAVATPEAAAPAVVRTLSGLVSEADVAKATAAASSAGGETH